MSSDIGQQDMTTRPRASSQAGPHVPAPSWCERLFKDPMTASAMLAFGPVTTMPGLEESLTAEADAHALVLTGKPGSDRLGWVRARHARRSSELNALLRIDCRSRSQLETGRDFVARATDCAANPGTVDRAESVAGITAFIDNAEALDAETLGEFVRLAGLRREGQPAPLLIFGLEAGDAGALADIPSIALPALSERPQDLVDFVRSRLADRVGAPRFDDAALRRLAEEPFESEAALGAFLDQVFEHQAGETIDAEQMNALLESGAGAPKLDESLADIEERQIYRVLEAYDWNRTRSAKVLGIDVKTLYNKLKRYESRKRHQQQRG